MIERLVPARYAPGCEAAELSHLKQSLGDLTHLSPRRREALTQELAVIELAIIEQAIGRMCSPSPTEAVRVARPSLQVGEDSSEPRAAPAARPERDLPGLNWEELRQDFASIVQPVVAHWGRVPGLRGHWKQRGSPRAPREHWRDHALAPHSRPDFSAPEAPQEEARHL